MLAGTIAAGARTRLYDATVLKVLGATRGRIALVYAIEYGLLGRHHRHHRAGGGHLAGLRHRHARSSMYPFFFDARAAHVTVAGAARRHSLFGLFGAMGALSARAPARRLRNG